MRQFIAILCLSSALLCNGSEFSQPTNGIGGKSSDVAFYVHGKAAGQQTTFGGAYLLPKNNNILIGGATTDTSWFPDVPRLAVSIDSNTAEVSSVKSEANDKSEANAQAGTTPFVLFLTPDCQSIRLILTFPKNLFTCIDKITSPSVPGMPVKQIYLSGKTSTGYSIVRLNTQRITSALKAKNAEITADWIIPLSAQGVIQNNQPWDVDSQGRVICAVGNPYSYDWTAVYIYGSDGKETTMPQWRTHWLSDGKEFKGLLAEAPLPAVKSAIVLKIWERGDFRSWNKEDYLAKVPDGNGGFNQGRWPFDAMFSGYFDLTTKKTAQVNADDRGWYGYRWGANPTACVSSICIDRRNDNIYIGGNNQSRLPEGQPDFEPWVTAMSPDGKLIWWVRLYPESKGVSTPDQYVDCLTIDYSVPVKSGNGNLTDKGNLIVVARCHGNNVNNFWNGNEIAANTTVGRKSFQPSFSGTSGNIHLLWLGRLRNSDGQMLAATYCGEYGESGPYGNKPFTWAKLAHWPDVSTGWAKLNTTRLRTAAVDASGNVWIAAVGRRVITTSDALLSMPSPLKDPQAKGNWSDFVRSYSSNLSQVEYSSLVSGVWDWQTGEGGSPAEVSSLIPLPDGSLIAIGRAPVNSKTGTATGNEMPTRNVPAWGSSAREGASAFIMKVHP